MSATHQKTTLLLLLVLGLFISAPVLAQKNENEVKAAGVPIICLDRTGALTAAYRITHDGWTANQAFAEMQRYDLNDGFFGGPSDQKRFVYSFYQHYLANQPAK